LKKNYDYTKEDIVSSLKKTGLKNGDSIFLHSNIGFFGRLEDVDNSQKYCEILKDAIFDVLGKNGTLIVPTFSLSFCNNQIYDRQNTESFQCGMFSEFIRQLKISKRSDDANFSVCAIGEKADYFTKEVSEHSFGIDSFWDRLWKENGKICRFNMSSDYNTFIHFVERKLNVVYRYDKEFTGISIINGEKINKKYYHFVRDLEKDEHISDLNQLDESLKKLGLLKTMNLGKGQMILMKTKDVFEIVKNEIKKNPYFLVKGKN
jgi:aminoglycoside 3-N-acetyltransferase